MCKGSGGWSAPRRGKAGKDAPAVQLFDLDADPAEKKNLAMEKPGVVESLTALLGGYVAEGRSTPGAKQENDGAVNIGPLQ